MKKEKEFPKLLRDCETGKIVLAISQTQYVGLTGQCNGKLITIGKSVFEKYYEPSSGVFNAQGEFVDLQNYAYPKYFKCTKEPYTLEIVKAIQPETAQPFPVGNKGHFFTALPITNANGNLVTNNSPRTCLKSDWEPITGNLTVVYDE